MFSYIGIIYAMLIDLFVFDDILNWIEWIGLAIIVFTVISLTIHVLLEKKQDQAAQKKTDQIDNEKVQMIKWR